MSATVAWRVVLITAPTAEPISTADLKTHLRVTGSTDDTYIDTLEKVARRYCEEAQNRAYITQTWELTRDAFPADRFIELPRAPLQSVTSVKYTDVNGVQATLASADYHVDTTYEPGRIVLKDSKDWPTDTLQATGAVVIRYIVGYGTAGTSVPATILHGIKLMVGHLYEHREAVTEDAPTELPIGLKALLQMERVFTFP